MTVDPAVDQTDQPYAYVDGDPVDNIDPSGLDACVFGVCVPTPSLHHVSDFAASFGDTITFGGTAYARGWINGEFGLENEVDYCSGWYAGGGYTALGVGLALGAPGMARDLGELGGGFLARARGLDWADESGSLRPFARSADDWPRLDRTGKVHGDLPTEIPNRWTKSDLEEFADDLRASIQTRENEAVRLGEHGPHRARIYEERQLLRQIEKRLSGS